MTDWSALRNEYESGASLRSLAEKHGISKSLIGKHKFQEKWKDKRLTVDAVDKVVDMPPPVQFPLSSDVLTIADLLLAQLLTHLQGVMDIRDIKSASDALAACAKVKMSFPAEQDTQDGLLIPFDRLSARTRMEIRRLLAEDEIQQQHAKEQVS